MIAVDTTVLIYACDQADARRAKELHLSRGASLWDALILAACVQAGVEILYSEDLPGFEDLEGVRVINPCK